MASPLLLPGIASIVLTPLQIAFAIELFALKLPSRSTSVGRIAFVVLGYELAACSCMLLIGSPLAGIAGFYGTQLISFSLIFLAATLAVLAAHECSIWSALFCSTAGYTLQNLTSGATDYLCRRLGFTLVDRVVPVERIPLGIACTVVIYLAMYLLFVRHIHRRGLAHVEDRSMLIMMVVVIFVIIGFDLVVKWFSDQSIPLWAATALRVSHSLACLFTLAMEYELLINRRLETERAVMEQVLAEHGRQYRQSKETIAAINARVHDIRHSVARLADGAEMDRTVLKQIIREVNVFDSSVRTGNEALDTALSEKHLMLGRAGVTLTCIADGTAVSFMSPADVYTLFSSLIDASASSGVTSISLIVREAFGSASVHLEYNGMDLDSELFATPQEIVQRYNGSFSAHKHDGALHVNILFPAR